MLGARLRVAEAERGAPWGPQCQSVGATNYNLNCNTLRHRYHQIQIQDENLK